jgi:hypothetical protein
MLCDASKYFLQDLNKYKIILLLYEPAGWSQLTPRYSGKHEHEVTLQVLTPMQFSFPRVLKHEKEQCGPKLPSEQKP